VAISYNTGTTGAATTTIPAGVLNHDVMLLVVNGFSNGTSPVVSVSSTGTAFTQIGTQQAGGTDSGYTAYGAIFYAVASASDAGKVITASVSGGGSPFLATALASYTGASNSAPVDVSGGANSGSSPLNFPAETTGYAGDWAIYLTASGDNGAGLTGPSGTTQRQLGNPSYGVYAGIWDGNGSAGAAGSSIGGSSFKVTASGTPWLTAFTIGLAFPSATNAPAGVAAATAAAHNATVSTSSGTSAPAGAVTAAAAAPGPVPAVTASAGVATAAAAAGNLTGASALGMVYSSTDGNGVETWTATSPMNGGAGHGSHACRILRPVSPPEGTPHAFLYCLPVSTEGDATYGSALDICQGIGTHNTYNVTLVEPTFYTYPWYADHPTDATIQQESFTVAIANWCLQHIAETSDGPANQGDEAHHLIGFSKSGYGGTGLLLRHPGLFGKGAFWDTPYDMAHYSDYSGGGSDAVYGTDANFTTNYKLSSSFVAAHDATFTAPVPAVPYRVWISGGVLYSGDVTDFDTLLTGVPVPHVYVSNSGDGTHEYASQWVGPAVAAILPATGYGPAAAVAPNAKVSASVLAGVAAAAAVAPNAALSVAPDAGAARALAVAPGPVAAAGVAAGAASAGAAVTGARTAVQAYAAVAVSAAAAPGASVSTASGTSAPAGAAGATATAAGSSVSAGIPASVAAAAGAASPPVPSVLVPAGVAAAAAVAPGATVSASSSGSASAGVAAAGAAAPGAGTAITATAGAAAVSAGAPGATVSTAVAGSAPAQAASASAVASAAALSVSANAAAAVALAAALASVVPADVGFLTATCTATATLTASMATTGGPA